MGISINTKESICLCGSATVMSCNDGGSRVCEKGHVFHTCRVDSIKKYGWCRCLLGKDAVACKNLPITFAKTKFA